MSSDLLQKVLKLVLRKATGPEVYFASITTVLSDSYSYLVETLNHLKIIKLKDHLWGNVEDCCDAILVNAERLESAVAFKTEHLGCIICIIKDNSNSRIRI